MKRAEASVLQLCSLLMGWAEPRGDPPGHTEDGVLESLCWARREV